MALRRDATTGRPFVPLSAQVLLPCPFDEVRQVVEQAERVEGVTDDLRDGPGRDEQQHAVLALHLRRSTRTQGVMGREQVSGRRRLI